MTETANPEGYVLAWTLALLALYAVLAITWKLLL